MYNGIHTIVNMKFTGDTNFYVNISKNIIYIFVPSNTILINLCLLIDTNVNKL